MGKLSKEEQAHFGGAAWMLDYVKEHGIESAEKELERRGVRHMPLILKKNDIRKFEEYEKKNTFATVLLMACATLRDEYGFGFDRLQRFIKRFNLKTTCLVDDYVIWKDLQRTIEQETGIHISLPEEFMEE